MSFEDRLAEILNHKIPHRFLSNVSVFRPDYVLDIGGMASEIDFLFHVQRGDIHDVVIVEAKGCRIEDESGSVPSADSKEWQAIYPDAHGRPKPKDIQTQVLNQIKALRMNMEPLQEGKRVKFWGIIVTNRDDLGSTMLKRERVPDPNLYLLHVSKFTEILSGLIKEGDVLRVQESEILRRLRFGQSVQELGHPEIPHAIEYARRCRAFLDCELFEHFKPTSRHWAINGSAGMGKSVLLAYALMVLSTDRFVKVLRDGSTRHLQTFETEATKLKMPKLEKRRIWAVALTERQKASLEDVYAELMRQYQKIDPFNNYQRVSPIIKLWFTLSSLDDCNILLIDESHDLNETAQDKILEWYQAKEDRFVIVACDRHQKLRFVSRDARILNGFDFSGRTTKLNRNYRNPFPVYSAAMALMFRWAAASGPKVIPTKDDLVNGLGFRMEGTTQDDIIKLSSREDAHPANNWSHLVAVYTGPREMENQLRETNLNQRDVLWVRFNREVPDFGYECLSRYTYHNLYSTDSADVIDKYIKGQEFPIVVIEGLPELFNVENFSDDKSQRAMWRARRELYLVASRATVFLFFVKTGSESSESTEELQTLVKQVSKPDVTARLNGPSGKVWTLEVIKGEGLSMDQYLNLLEPSDYENVVAASPSEETSIPEKSDGDQMNVSSVETQSSTSAPRVKPVRLSEADIVERANGSNRFSAEEIKIHREQIRLARKQMRGAKRKSISVSQPKSVPPANVKPPTAIPAANGPVPQLNIGSNSSASISNKLKPVVFCRPVTPAIIAKTLSLTREEVADAIQKLKIHASLNTELNDKNVGKVARSLGYKGLISGNIPKKKR